MARKKPTAGMHSKLGVYFHSCGAYDLALAELTKALKLLPFSATAHYNMGAVYLDLKRYDEAIQAFRTALHLDPGHVRAHLQLGLALEAVGRRDEALANFETVLTLDPSWRDGRIAREEIVRLQPAHEKQPPAGQDAEAGRQS